MNKYIDTVVVLGGSLKKEKEKWRTTHFDEGDNFGGLGDRLRVVAAYYLYKKNPNTPIITIGGRGKLEGVTDAPAVSEVIKEELIDFGVPEEKIVTETKSGNTLEGLIALQEIILKENYARSTVISNEYHVPRIKVMIECSDKLSTLLNMLSLGTLNLLSAESVCLDNEKTKWESLIQNAYQSELIKKRIRLETQGVEDIKKGRYVLK